MARINKMTKKADKLNKEYTLKLEKRGNENLISDYIQTLKNFRKSIQSILNFRIESDDSKRLSKKSYVIPNDLREFHYVLRHVVEGNDIQMNDTNIQHFDRKKLQHYKNTITKENKKIVMKDPTTLLDHEKFVQFDKRVTEEKKQDLKLTLLNLASTFEVLINKSLEYHLLYVEKGPGSMGNKNIKYSDIYDLDRTEIKKKYVDMQISDIMYKSFDEWIEQFFELCCQKDLSPLKDDNIRKLSKNISKLFQKRNIIIHNNGIINELYLKKVSNSEENIGDELVITENYLKSITRDVSKFGIFLITNHIHKKKLLRNGLLCKYLSNECLPLLDEGYYEETRMITKILRDEIDNELKKNLYTETQIRNKAISDFIHRYNYWLSFYLNNQRDEIQSDIEDYISKNETEEWYKKDDQVQLGISSLMETKEEFVDTAIRYCQKISDSGKINVVKTLDWPLFKLIEDENKFLEFSDQMKYSEIVKETKGEIVMLNNSSDEMKKDSENTKSES